VTRSLPWASARRGGIEMHIGEQIGIGFVSEEGGQQRKLRIGEAVVRHGRSRIVDARVVQPGLQPFGFHLVADPRQFWADITAHHVSGGVLHGVAGSAERLAVQLAPAVGSGAFSFLLSGAVSPAIGVLLAIRNAEISRASGSLNLKFGMVAVTAYA